MPDNSGFVFGGRGGCGAFGGHRTPLSVGGGQLSNVRLDIIFVLTQQLMTKYEKYPPTYA